MQQIATFRFYEELNDFLPEHQKKKWIDFNFKGKVTVKQAIELFGIPHTEVDMILINSKAVGFEEYLKSNDKVSVYPVFEKFDISKTTRLREIPLRNPKFILDVHLGKLSKYIRMFGFDALFDNKYSDKEIINIAEKEKRCVLTRNKSLLMRKNLNRGYWVRSIYPKNQIREVIKTFDLFNSVKPFHRCMLCNGLITKVSKDEIKNFLNSMPNLDYNEFFRCSGCDKIYWKGSHYFRMKKSVDELLTTDIKSSTF